MCTLRMKERIQKDQYSICSWIYKDIKCKQDISIILIVKLNTVKIYKYSFKAHLENVSTFNVPPKGIVNKHQLQRKNIESLFVFLTLCNIWGMYYIVHSTYEYLWKMKEINERRKKGCAVQITITIYIFYYGLDGVMANASVLPPINALNHLEHCHVWCPALVCCCSCCFFRSEASRVWDWNGDRYRPACERFVHGIG